MISLTQFILESTATRNYGVLLDHIEFKKIPEISKLTSLIKEGIIEANSRYKVLRIEAVERINDKRKQWDADKFKKELASEEKRVIAYMQTKPGIMKRSEEKRQKYINDKLEKFKSEWKGSRLDAVEYDENKIRFAWHMDIHSEHSYTQLGYKLDRIDQLAENIAEYIDNRKGDETWSHLTGINISVDNSGLTDQWSPCFHIIPMFDEETEKTLSKEVQRFCDFMTGEYNSGRYMGD